MIKVRQISVEQATVNNFSFYTNNPHLVYVENAQGYLVYKGNVIKINEQGVVLIPALEKVQVSIYSDDSNINISLYSWSQKHKGLREKLYSSMSEYSHLNMYMRKFSSALISNFNKKDDYLFIDIAKDIIFEKSDSITCKNLAYCTHTTIQTLNRRLQKLGTSGSKLIIDIKLRKARLLLARTNKKISDISQTIGINQSYFSVIFKNEYGLTPSEFRGSFK